MNPNRSFRIAAVAAGVALAVSAPARADLKYTMQTTLLGDQAKHAGQFSMTMTTYVKGGNQRQDSNISAGPMQMGSETLTLCGKQQTISVSQAAKVYTVSSMRAVSAFMPSVPPMGPMGRGGNSSYATSNGGDTGGTGTEDVTMTVDDLGPDKVNNIDAHHYMLHIATQSTGCAGHESGAIKFEVWVADLVLGGVACPSAFGSEHPVVPAGGAGGGCQTTTTMHGDTAKLMSIFSHMMVKQIMYDKDGKPVMMNEIVDYSAAPVDESVFEVPDGFQQVGQSDFQKAQQRAMMQQIMGGRGGADDGPPDQQAPPTDNGGNPAPGDNNGDQAPPKKKGGFHLPGGFHL